MIHELTDAKLELPKCHLFREARFEEQYVMNKMDIRAFLFLLYYIYVRL